MRNLHLSALAALALTAALAACGGGGGGTPPVNTTPTPNGTATPHNTTSPSPSPSPSPTTAAVSGTVVDYTANTPVAGVQVALAPWTAGATPVPEATTNASGQFSFSVKPGQYLAVIGSNSPTATTATLHESVTIVGGTNVLTGATPIPEPGVTPVASQTAGALRLMTLNSVQQDCLAGANAGRSSISLPLLVPDEYLEEDAVAWNTMEDAQGTDTPAPIWGSGTQPYGQFSGMTTSAGFDPCDVWTNGYSYTNGNPPYPFATNAANMWYGGMVDETNTPHYGAQIWMDDPR